jgi:predicted TIM-barrel fold metal-dependent hydrolase
MLNRRRFIGTSFAAGTAAAAGAHSATAQRKRVIVDAQMHLWKAESADWKWVPGAKPQLPEPFTIEKAVPLMDEAGVDRVVVVPPSWPGDRNDYALEAAKRYPKRFGIMGRFPMQDPKSAARLPKWKEQPGMLGVRLTFLTPTMVGWLKDGTADWFWPAVEKAGLPVMFLASMQGPAFVRIAERHPQLTLIVDHMGVTSAVVQAGRIGDAIKDTLSLAKFPNVSVKLSSAPLMSKEPYPYADMTPHIRALFEAYGPRRCYWGTDITNSFHKATYRQRIAHFTETLGFLSEDDKDWVMGRAILERLKWA